MTFEKIYIYEEDRLDMVCRIELTLFVIVFKNHNFKKYLNTLLIIFLFHIHIRIYLKEFLKLLH